MNSSSTWILRLKAVSLLAVAFAGLSTAILPVWAESPWLYVGERNGKSIYLRLMDRSGPLRSFVVADFKSGRGNGSVLHMEADCEVHQYRIITASGVANDGKTHDFLPSELGIDDQWTQMNFNENGDVQMNKLVCGFTH